MSKSAQSGLRTVKRDFSSSSQLSEDIPWLPTQPQQPVAKFTSQSQRLKDIQDALSGKPLYQSTNLSALAEGSNKRSSPEVAAPTVTKRPRQLPPDWVGKDILSEPSLRPKPRSTSPSSKDTWNKKSTTSSSTYIPPPSSSSSTSKAKVAPVFLSREQTQILELVKEGHSVFYTGSAGTGKSVLLREVIKSLRKKHISSPDAIAITASTGIAACNIGGVTIHSFAGIGLGVDTAEDLASKVRKNRKATSRWLRTKVLIIDEVSMVDGDLFDKLAYVGKIIRKKPEPFGGLQVIVTGDFFQLPPVSKGTTQVKFAFEAEQWNQTIQRTFNLTKVFRQSDQVFIDMLNEMRFGRLSMKSIAKFKSLSRDIEYEDGLGPTELFPRREDVDRSNSTRMSRLQTQQERFLAVDGGAIRDKEQRQKMLANFMAPEVLLLRIDAQVMLIKNVDETLVNGSMGRVIRFVDPAVYGTDMDNGGGLLEEKSVIGASNAVTGVGSAAKKNAPSAAAQVKLYPVVEFLLPNGGRRLLLVMPEVWKVELPDGEIQVSRSQLPLILAWAMSIHKSQGQTLERVKVDLGKVFEKGQAYVALSRATSLDGLQVLNFDANKVNAHPKVAIWSKTLETVKE